jgi:hypothetical protein
MTNYHLTQISRNSKLGAIPVTTSGAQTCPDACPLKGGGCNMEVGRQAMHWRKVTDGQRGGDWAHLVDELTRKTYPTQVWRHNVSGDLAGDGVNIAPDKLADLVKVNKGKRGFTYTHYDTIENAENREAVKAANAGGFIVNLSGNNLYHADKLADLEAAPVVTVLPTEYAIGENETVPEYKARLSTLPKTTPQGRPVTVCPATYLGGVSCATCKLCAAPNRRAIIGFPADGIRKKQADAIASQ